MPRPDPKKRFVKIFKLLKKIYPTTKPALTYSNNFQLLIATILSAQTTDKQVNQVTPHLFKQYNTPQALAKAPLEKIEKLIHSTGFYKNKAKNIKACSQQLVTQFNSQVPETMKELTTLAGVGRKTANVVLSHGFGKNEGVCVDTHVGRVAQILEFTKQKDPTKIEQDLMKLTPQKMWHEVTHVLINHGRHVCIARRPQCVSCVLKKECRYFKKISN